MFKTDLEVSSAISRADRNSEARGGRRGTLMLVGQQRRKAAIATEVWTLGGVTSEVIDDSIDYWFEAACRLAIFRRYDNANGNIVKSHDDVPPAFGGAR